jgi:hypothetical protein
MVSKISNYELRDSSTENKIFKKAQKLSDVKSISILISEKDREVFFEAVFGDIKPNQHLIDASERFKSKTYL